MRRQTISTFIFANDHLESPAARQYSWVFSGLPPVLPRGRHEAHFPSICVPSSPLPAWAKDLNSSPKDSSSCVPPQAAGASGIEGALADVLS